jgi:hypothetical protein
MTKASARVCAVPSAALLLCLASPDARASDRVSSTAAVTIQGSAAVTIINTVVNNAPLQTLLLTAAIAPANVVFSAPGSNTGVGLVSVGGSGGGPGSGGRDSASAAGGGADPAGPGLPRDDGGPPALIVIGGALTGTTIDGNAVSVSVGDVSGGSRAGSAKVPVIIAQYN